MSLGTNAFCVGALSAQGSVSKAQKLQQGRRVDSYSSPPTSVRVKKNVIFSLAAAVKSSGKAEVAVISIRKCAPFIYCISKKLSAAAPEQRADTLQHNEGRNPGWRQNFSASHPRLWCPLPPSRQLPPRQRTPMLISAFVWGDLWNAEWFRH